MSDRIVYDVVRFDVDAMKAQALPLCRSTIPDFEDAYLLDRLRMVRDPVLVVASDGQFVGFKLGYVKEPGVFYSWLGGVAVEARRRGLASGLMLAQHREVETQGIGVIETRCRAGNTPMLILNLRHGFNVVGFEVDATRGPVVLQRKRFGSATVGQEVSRPGAIV